MRRLKITGLALLALFALGALAASMASGEEGVLPNANSTGEGGAATLETTNNESIKCTKVAILEGKFLTEKEKDQHGTANLHFTGCKAEGIVPFNTLGDEKEVLLSKVLFLVCLVEPAKLVFGILIRSLETEHIEVPATKELILIKGAVIAELEGAGLKGKDFNYKLEGKAGVQKVATKCVINGKEFKHSLESANDKKATDLAVSETAKFLLLFEKEVEFMDE